VASAPLVTRRLQEPSPYRRAVVRKAERGGFGSCITSRQSASARIQRSYRRGTRPDRNRVRCSVRHGHRCLCGTSPTRVVREEWPARAEELCCTFRAAHQSGKLQIAQLVQQGLSNREIGCLRALDAIRAAALWLGVGNPADCAASNMLPSRFADALSGTASPAPAKASLEAVGVCARPGGRAVVQRSVHDMASLQYQRMSAHAGPPSGTNRPSGSAMPHMEH
jgi:hypothetical protein